MQTEISTEGLTNALLEAAEAEERKKREKEVIVWCHLLRAELKSPEYWLPRAHKLSKSYLFRAMNSKTMRWKFQQGIKNFTTDEVPTQWMKDLYAEFNDWKANSPSTHKDIEQYSYMNDKARSEVGGEKIRKKKKNAKTIR